MTNRRWVSTIVLVGILSLFHAQTVRAQVTPERLAAIKARAEQVKAFTDRLPQHVRQGLSSGTLKLIHLAERWDQIESRLGQAPLAPSHPREAIQSHGLGQEVLRSRIRGPTRVSNPSIDRGSLFEGFTQSETSTAWCGNTVVVGFNDSGSSFESLSQSSSGTGGLSTVGVARSTDKGKSFTDLGFLNPGPGAADLTFSDPVLGCTDQNTFYYATMFLREVAIKTPLTSSTAIASDISVSKSIDGGATWENPVSTVSKDFSVSKFFSGHLLDKPWMAVDPTDTNRLYVTYTDFDVSGACGWEEFWGYSLPRLRIAIEMVRSTDGGITWSTPPLVITEGCTSEDWWGESGSQVAVGPSGEVYVVWLAFGSVNEIIFRKSTDNGMSFEPAWAVPFPLSGCVGNCGGLLKGQFRVNQYPSLAVGRSGSATNGFVYIAWNDAGDVVRNPFPFSDYSPVDVFVTSSTDGGDTWSYPVRVNNNPEPSPSGLYTDQYQPAIAVDKRGTVGVCFYDRRRDPNNLLIDRFCAKSTDAGATWRNKRITQKPFPPVPCQDTFMGCEYMGDYDTLASDFTQVHSGFIGAWGDNSRGNPDVLADRF